MPFPEVSRVIYKRNPLEKVICQLRFPPILKIDAEIPADFQDKIREDFPNYSEKMEVKVEVPKGVKIPIELVKQAVQSSGLKNYEFSSDDGQWQINLTRTFIAFSTFNYKKWEGFREKLINPLQALIDIYSPNSFSRIGLRYVDVIRRSKLELKDVGWSDLLQPYILGILSTPRVGGCVQNFENKYDILLSDNESMVKVISKFVESAEDSEKCFMIDSDFYNKSKIKLDAAMAKLDYFNKRASRLIQWCITDDLHKAMIPEELPEE